MHATSAPPGQAASTTRDFMRFWCGQTLAEFGIRIGAIAMPVLAVDLLHATDEQIGFLTAASTVSFLLIGLPAGAWVDRWLKRRTMIVADAVRMAVTVVIPLLWFAGQLRIWHMYIVAAIIGLATVFFDVAYQSYIPVLVPEGEIGRANARLEATAQLATSGGPAIGGLLMHIMTAPVVMISNTLAYAASLATLAYTRDSEPHLRATAVAERKRRHLRAEIGEGLRYVWNQAVIRRLVASMGLSNLFAATLTTLLPVLVLRRVGLDPFTLGVIMTCGSIGGAVGAALAPALQRRFHTGTVIAGALASTGLFALLNPVAGCIGPGSKLLASIVLIAAETGMVASALVFNVTQVSLRQRLCPKHLLGRMNASIRFVVWGVSPFGSLLAGWLGSRFGVVTTMWIGGVGALLTIVPILGIGRLIAAERDA